MCFKVFCNSYQTEKWNRRIVDEKNDAIIQHP